jgi:hypothetical protein
MLVGITGPAGSGKDTVADYLVREHGFVKLSFAGPLKAMLAAAGMPEPADRALKEHMVPGFTFTWREAAQTLGTQWGRALDPEIWVKVVEQRLLSAAPSARYVLSDVRFENEAAMIRRCGGTVLHMTGRAADLGVNAAHASEAGIAVFAQDWVVANGGALENTFRRVDQILFGSLV